MATSASRPPRRALSRESCEYTPPVRDGSINTVVSSRPASVKRHQSIPSVCSQLWVLAHVIADSRSTAQEKDSADNKRYKLCTLSVTPHLLYSLVPSASSNANPSAV